MLEDPFQQLDPKTLRDSVTGTIRRAILRGNLLPGEQVNQAQIAEKLGVSRGPVREALRQLEEEGLIQNIAYKGTFVTEITPEYIEELFSIRRVLEGFAVRRTVEVAQSDDLNTLRATVDGMREAVEVSDLDRSGELDLRFHYLICRSAHHNLLMQMWRSIESGLRLCLAHGHRVYEDPRDIVGTHPDILEAIEAKDADRAAELLDGHIREAGEAIYQSWVAVTELSAGDGHD